MGRGLGQNTKDVNASLAGYSTTSLLMDFERDPMLDVYTIHIQIRYRKIEYESQYPTLGDIVKK